MKYIYTHTHLFYSLFYLGQQHLVNKHTVRCSLVCSSGLFGRGLFGGQQHLVDSVKDPVGSVVVGQGHDRVVVKRNNGPGLGASHVEDLHQDFLALQGRDLLVVGEVAGGHVALCHVVGENFGQKRHIGQDLLQSTGGQALKGEVVLRGGGGAEFARVGWVRR